MNKLGKTITSGGKSGFSGGIAGFTKHFVYIALCIMTLFPVYFIISSSFKTQKEYTLNKLLVPHDPVIENYIEAFRGKEFLTWLMNSLILTIGAVFLTVLIACLAAFAFGKMEFRGKDTILSIIISLMVVPPIVMIIPLFKMMASLNLIDSYFSVILIYTALSLPFSIYLLTNFFYTIPNHIIDSSKIDGCSDLRVLFNIILPLSKPPIITLIAVNALYVWSELLIALVFLQSNRMKTLMVGVTVFEGRYSINIPVTMAAMVMATIPMAILYIFGQRYFIRGITAGSTKG